MLQLLWTRELQLLRNHLPAHRLRYERLRTYFYDRADWVVITCRGLLEFVTCHGHFNHVMSCSVPAIALFCGRGEIYVLGVDGRQYHVNDHLVVRQLTREQELDIPVYFLEVP